MEATLEKMGKIYISRTVGSGEKNLVLKDRCCTVVEEILLLFTNTKANWEPVCKEKEKPAPSVFLL